MPRRLRIEYPNAIHHVTSRGDRQEPIFADDIDRCHLLDIVAEAMRRFDVRALAYCLMGNHFHFVVQTPQANLSRVMRQINGIYTQTFNRRHGKVGHLFQGRFHAAVIDAEAYLLAVARYVELNPVRAGLVASPADWEWSSFRAHIGLTSPLPWLDVETMHGHLLGRDVRDFADRRNAIARYESLIASAHDASPWKEGLRHGIYLGDEAFVERVKDLSARSGKKLG